MVAKLLTPKKSQQFTFFSTLKIKIKSQQLLPPRPHLYSPKKTKERKEKPSAVVAASRPYKRDP
jgi:hypothetical protein